MHLFSSIEPAAHVALCANPRFDERMATSYWDYIRVEDLLALQNGLKERDCDNSRHELLFITVHQVFELWFKLVLTELVTLRDVLTHDPVEESDVPAAVTSLRRVQTIMESAIKHFDVVETLQTKDYLDFRDELFPASGFQSRQMREIEIVLGLKDEERIGLGEDGAYLQALHGTKREESVAAKRVRARREDKPSLKEALDRWLYRTPIHGSQPGDANDEATVNEFLADYTRSFEAATRTTQAVALESGIVSERVLQERYSAEIESAKAFLYNDDPIVRRVRAATLFIESYRSLPLLAWPRELIASVVAFEQMFVMWRSRHARMVERIIGRRTGTGGSSGVDYLDDTARYYRVFKDLWAARTLQVPEHDLPPIKNQKSYEFHT